MMFSVDPYLGMRFDLTKFNCWDFIRIIYKDIHGVDIHRRTPAVLNRATLIAAFNEQEHDFQPIDKPTNGCIVYFTRANKTPHVGIYRKGRVLHLPKTGVIYQDLTSASLGWEQIRFYTCKK